ncbi:uncharacterized protein LOC129269983 [Lytechinus pictus]|uniref:uncharacterized protein LOC129269983 n=1 Tax=Lytechinus pictus TaxID=7653 RepID=UPI0030B9DE0D
MGMLAILSFMEAERNRSMKVKKSSYYFNGGQEEDTKVWATYSWIPFLMCIIVPISLKRMSWSESKDVLQGGQDIVRGKTGQDRLQTELLRGGVFCYETSINAEPTRLKVFPKHDQVPFHQKCTGHGQGSLGEKGTRNSENT